MSGRSVALTIHTTDQPELSDAVQVQLEKDRLFFLETHGRVSYIRPMVEGEALPYAPHASAMVYVKPHQREFFVFGKQTLIIRCPHETAKREKSHQSFAVSAIQRERAEARKAKAASAPMETTDEEKEIRRQQEKIRRAAEVQAKEDRRRGITALKRAEKLKRLAARRASDTTLPQLTLIGPAVVDSPNAA